MIVIDTHVLLWYLSDSEKISKKALKLIEEAKMKDMLCVSSISIWEICVLEKTGKLKLNVDARIWIRKCESLGYFNFIPANNEIAELSVHLPEPLHKDPADRMIIATAKYIGGVLITRDEKLLSYKAIQAVW